MQDIIRTSALNNTVHDAYMMARMFPVHDDTNADALLDAGAFQYMMQYA
jgi:hypothetical protein